MRGDGDTGTGHLAGEAGFLDALLAHLRAPSDASWAALSGAAEGLSATGGHGAEGVAGWAREIGVRVGPLLEGDHAAWARLLRDLASRPPGDGWDAEDALRDASPFRDRILVFERTGEAGAPRYAGDVDALVEQAVWGLVPVSLPGGAKAYAIDRTMPASEPPTPPDEDPGSVGC